MVNIKKEELVKMRTKIRSILKKGEYNAAEVHRRLAYFGFRPSYYAVQRYMKNNMKKKISGSVLMESIKSVLREQPNMSVKYVHEKLTERNIDVNYTRLLLFYKKNGLKPGKLRHRSKKKFVLYSIRKLDRMARKYKYLNASTIHKKMIDSGLYISYSTVVNHLKENGIKTKVVG